MAVEDNNLHFVAIYTFRFPGFWHATKSTPQNRIFNVEADPLSQRLYELAGIADQTYQHPRQLTSMKRYPLEDLSIGPLANGKQHSASVALLACEDDVAVISVLVCGVPLGLDVVFSLLDTSRPLSGRYRSNEFVVASDYSKLQAGTVFKAFADSLATICEVHGLRWPKNCVGDYYPFFTILDSSGEYSKDNRSEDCQRKLAAMLSAERGHLKGLEQGWAKRHLGPDLSHTKSREFYATEHGALYIIELSTESELIESGEGRVENRVMERVVATLTFLEIFRAQVVLLRQLDMSLEEILRFRLQTAGLRDVIRLYLASIQSLTRYENLAVQTTPWRKYAWRYIRKNYLQEPFDALSLKLGRIERILDIFDRLKVQTFLVTLSVVLGVLSIVPNTSWRTSVKVTVVLLTSVVLVLLVWYLQDQWWRRRVFGPTDENSPGDDQ